MKLKSAELVNALRAAYKQLNVMTQSSVNIGQTVFKAEQGNFLLFANYFDSVIVDDQAGAEDALHYHLSRAFNIDNPEVADLYAATFYKAFADFGAVTDIDVLHCIKAALDEIAIVDSHVKHIYKNRSNKQNVVLRDDKAKLHPNKVTGDTLSLTDENFIATSLAKTDLSDVADLYEAAVDKALGEIVTGVGDQAFIFAKKVAEHYVSMVDAEAMAFGKGLSEATTLTDTDYLTVSKPLSESSAATDEVNTKATTKALANSVGVTDDVDGAASILDDQEMQFVKFRTDVSSITDTFYRQVNFTRAFTDTGGVSDSDYAFAVDKSLADSSVASEVYNLLTGKQVYDISTVSESAEFVFSRPLANSTLTSDNDVWSFGKGVTNSTSFTDAGSLRSQGYSDFAYFGEDFVGASKTF